MQCFEHDTSYDNLVLFFFFFFPRFLRSCCNTVVRNGTRRHVAAQAFPAPASTAQHRGCCGPARGARFCSLVPHLPPDPLSWRTEPPQQNSPRPLQVWTVPLGHTGDNQAPQSGIRGYLILNGDNPAASPWRRRSHRDTDLEHVLFRSVLNSSFPSAIRPFVLFVKFITY